MKSAKISHEGNPNIGLFMFCNDKFCLLGKGFREEQKDDVQKSMAVPVYTCTVLGSNLVGIFIAGNNKAIVVPEQIEEHEFERIKKICDEHDVQVSKIKSNLNALGNNIVCNDQGALENPEFSEDAVNHIEKALEVNVQRSTIASFSNVGSLVRTTNEGALISEDALPEEKKILEKTLKCEAVSGTINNSRYISSGLVVNSNGCVISEDLFGGEVLYIKDAFFNS